MIKRTAVALVLSVAAGLAVVTSPFRPRSAAASNHPPIVPGFAPGLWTGHVTFSGGISSSRATGTIGGTAPFRFTIGTNGIAESSSHIDFKETLALTGREGTSNGSVTGSMRLEGNAARIVGRGLVHFHLDYPPQLGLAPLDSDVPGVIYLDPARRTCAKAGGDAAAPALPLQAAAGFTSTVHADFVAQRSAGRRTPDAAQIAAHEREVVSSINEFLSRGINRPSRPARSIVLLVTAGAVRNLNAIVAAAAACGRASRGYEHGLRGNATVGKLIDRLINAAIDTHLLLDTPSLLQTLEAALELKHPKAAALESALEDTLARPPDSTDRDNLGAALTFAHQYGLPRLAALAEMLLARLP